MEYRLSNHLLVISLLLPKIIYSPYKFLLLLMNSGYITICSSSIMWPINCRIEGNDVERVFDVGFVGIEGVGDWNDISASTDEDEVALTVELMFLAKQMTLWHLAECLVVAVSLLGFNSLAFVLPICYNSDIC